MASKIIKKVTNLFTSASSLFESVDVECGVFPAKLELFLPSNDRFRACSREIDLQFKSVPLGNNEKNILKKGNNSLANVSLYQHREYEVFAWNRETMNEKL